MGEWGGAKSKISFLRNSLVYILKACAKKKNLRILCSRNQIISRWWYKSIWVFSVSRILPDFGHCDGGGCWKWCRSVPRNLGFPCTPVSTGPNVRYHKSRRAEKDARLQRVENSCRSYFPTLKNLSWQQYFSAEMHHMLPGNWSSQNEEMKRILLYFSETLRYVRIVKPLSLVKPQVNLMKLTKLVNIWKLVNPMKRILANPYET